MGGGRLGSLPVVDADDTRQRELLRRIRVAHEEVEAMRELALLELDDDETADYMRDAAEILRGADVHLGERLDPPDLPDFLGEHQP
jgi:hypothetical protein